MSDAIYQREGDRAVPLAWAAGPWSERHQHGGPVNALLVSAVERAAAESGFEIVRIGVDLLRPVPMRPLRLVWEYARRGRRIAVVEARLLDDDGARVAQATSALYAASEDAPSSWSFPEEALPGPAAATSAPFMHKAFREHAPPGFHWSLEMRTVEGVEPHAAWIRTPLELFAGAPMTPLQQLAAICDLTYGFSARSMLLGREVDLSQPRQHMINTDTTIYLERAPVGEWFCFRQGTVTDRRGIGIASVVLYDERGRCGRSIQGLLANPR